MLYVRAIVLLSLFGALPFVAISPSSAHQAQPVMYKESRRLMWTQFEIVAYGTDKAKLAEAADAAFDEIDRLDKQMSNYSETSELTYINRNAAEKDVIVEKELFDLLKFSFDASKDSDGTFDITVGPLMKAWGFFKGQGRIPEPSELKSVMSTVGSKHVIADESKRTIRFDRDGVELDLGGIAKGYAVDKAAQILRQSGVTSAMITSGSSIYAIGAPPNQSGWKIEVTNPLDLPHSATSVELKDDSISTSGCYDKNFTIGGKTYCHIMDPRTGYPIDGILSATIITPRGVDAEVYSKVLMIMGIDGAKVFLKRHTDVRAILLYRLPHDMLGIVKLNFE